MDVIILLAKKNINQTKKTLKEKHNDSFFYCRAQIMDKIAQCTPIIYYIIF